jgi:hypothetical protein
VTCDSQSNLGERRDFDSQPPEPSTANSEVCSVDVGPAVADRELAEDGLLGRVAGLFKPRDP